MINKSITRVLLIFLHFMFKKCKNVLTASSNLIYNIIACWKCLASSVGRATDS